MTGRELETVEQLAVRIAHGLGLTLGRPVHRREAEAGIREEIALGRIILDERGRVLGRKVPGDLAAALDAFEVLAS